MALSNREVLDGLDVEAPEIIEWLSGKLARSQPEPTPQSARQPITCNRCGNTLGERVGEIFLLQHRGRLVVFPGLPINIRCEDCGATWRPREWSPIAGLERILALVFAVIPKTTGRNN